MHAMQTVSTVSKSLGISSRMLRYYEQVGLIESRRMEGYAYRVYDEVAIRRLRQIIILRKFRVPVKQIHEIFNNHDATHVVEIFERNLNKLDKEMTALSTVRSLLNTLIQEMKHKANMQLQLDCLTDNSVLAIVEKISFPKNTLQEEKPMEELSKANETLNQLTDVRVIYLPPMTVAAASATGNGCEDIVADLMTNFVKAHDLLQIKPDIRHFGFDCSQGATGIGENSQKYQMWVTIPENMPVPEPLVKRTFTGGLYAAHMIQMGDFDHWSLLRDWVSKSDQYENDWQSIRVSPLEDDMDRCLEEQLNYRGNLQNPNFDHGKMQLDLLFPIKEKTTQEP
ncbi:MerR family transcriptional regulator [Enterococcus sp. DIV0876]|uniref:MerR family transcriptional regulator n=1 Tax=Enterococcus sp. DIV0876 TaxID=2774633 RepID=UPI003D2FCD42